jgi:hypothetical protein
MAHLDGTDDGVGYGVRGTGNNKSNPQGSGVRGTNPKGTYGVYGDAAGVGVYGTATAANGVGVQGNCSFNFGRGVQGIGPDGVYGSSNTGFGNGVWGVSNTGNGVRGETASSYQPGVGTAGVWGINYGTGPGVQGTSAGGDAVIGLSSSNAHAGVSAVNDSGGFGIWARGTPAGHFEGNVEINGSLNAASVDNGVVGQTSSNLGDEGGVVGICTGGGNGVLGKGGLFGVSGESTFGVHGRGDSTGAGVYGFGGLGVWGQVNGQTLGEKAILGSVEVTRQQGGQGWSGYFDDAVHVTGFLEKAGGGFKIDHPEDPAYKYLNHSFVESAEMKNIYDGTVTLDAHGKATVTMPSWFEALNRSFCYQLTSIGSPSPELHIASELQNGKFQIAGGKPRSKVSWQVTGVRNDAWAKANQIPVEEEKSHGEHGHYLHPSLFGQSEDKSVLAVQQPTHFELLRKMRERDR